MLDLIKDVDRLVKSNMKYKTESKDTWNSYADLILNAKKFKKVLVLKGDCDDFAMTAIDLAYIYGVETSRLARVICWANNDTKPEGHMVALYKHTDGEYYYFGDTFGGVCNINDRDHKITLVNWLNDKKEWIKWNDN